MLIMVLVATLASGMVWLQWRGIEVESAERARAEGEWLLNGSLDWGNLILKSQISGQNAANYKEDDLGQPWATPLAETKLSSFLSADGSHADDSGPEAYLSGQITDAQSKYNLYNLYTGTAGYESGRFEQLCADVGVSSETANAIETGLRNSQPLAATAPAIPPANGAGGQTSVQATNVALMPVRISDLVWYGVDPAQIRKLEPYIQLLPVPGVPAPTMINVNTAPAEVLMAAYPGLSRAQAAQIILKRQQKPLVQGDLVAPLVPAPPANPANAPAQLGAVKSEYFEIYGQLRYEQHVLRERSVVRRVGGLVTVLRRERLPPDAP